MDLSDAISGRRSIRDYTAQSVDDHLIQLLIDAAARAPSAMNEQPWRFTVVRDPAVLARISLDAKRHMLASAQAEPASGHVQTMLSDLDFNIFYYAPVLILISAASNHPYVIEDCALAAENLMLAAYGAGLGTCWIGLAQSFLNSPAGKSELQLDPASVAVAPIIVGHPKTVLPSVPRKAPEVHWIG